MYKILEKLDMKKVAMRLMFVVVAIMFVTGACSILNKQVGLDDDHPAEELLEEVIKAQTGMDLDLTPESKE